jgi:hypothetical protein
MRQRILLRLTNKKDQWSRVNNEMDDYLCRQKLNRSLLSEPKLDEPTFLYMDVHREKGAMPIVQRDSAQDFFLRTGQSASGDMRRWATWKEFHNCELNNEVNSNFDLRHQFCREGGRCAYCVSKRQARLYALRGYDEREAAALLWQMWESKDWEIPDTSTICSFMLSIQKTLKKKTGLLEYFAQFAMIRLAVDTDTPQARSSIRRVVAERKLGAFRVVKKVNSNSNAFFYLVGERGLQSSVVQNG